MKIVAIDFVVGKHNLRLKHKIRTVTKIETIFFFSHSLTLY